MRYTPEQQDEHTRLNRIRRIALRRGCNVSKSRSFGAYLLAELDGANPKTFATLEELEEHLGVRANAD
jgi:hypothetical protein